MLKKQCFLVRKLTSLTPLLASLFVVLSAAAPARGQTEPRAEHKAAARTLGIEGIQLADAGNCEAAIEKLARAEQLYHAPTILARLGECQVLLGRVVEGTENLNRVVREPLPADAPSAFVQAKERAQRVLDVALPRIAQLTIDVQPSGIGPTVSIDGVEMPAVLLGVERPTDPGTHRLVVRAPGYLLAEQDVTLDEGENERVTITMISDPNAQLVEPVPSPPPAPAAAPATRADISADTGSSPTLGYVLLGVGGAGLIAGSVFGILAQGKKSELDDRCLVTEVRDKPVCGEGERDTLDAAKRNALLSTIGFSVGVAAAGVGLVLVLTSGSSEEHAAHAKTTTLTFGPGSATLRGTF